MPPELNVVPCPWQLHYLWLYFLSMCRRRTSNGYGPNPLSDEAVQAWKARHRIRLAAWEEDLLDELEGLYMKHMTPKTPEKETIWLPMSHR